MSERCDVTSSITGNRCELEAGHRQWSTARFHKFGPATAGGYFCECGSCSRVEEDGCCVTCGAQAMTAAELVAEYHRLQLAVDTQRCDITAGEAGRDVLRARVAALETLAEKYRDKDDVGTAFIAALRSRAAELEAQSARDRAEEREVIASSCCWECAAAIRARKL